jgi:hypothetical protein
MGLKHITDKNPNFIRTPISEGGGLESALVHEGNDEVRKNAIDLVADADVDFETKEGAKTIIQKG